MPPIGRRISSAWKDEQQDDNNNNNAKKRRNERRNKKNSEKSQKNRKCRECRTKKIEFKMNKKRSLKFTEAHQLNRSRHTSSRWLPLNFRASKSLATRFETSASSLCIRRLCNCQCSSGSRHRHYIAFSLRCFVRKISNALNGVEMEIDSDTSATRWKWRTNEIGAHTSNLQCDTIAFCIHFKWFYRRECNAIRSPSVLLLLSSFHDFRCKAEKTRKKSRQRTS